MGELDTLLYACCPKCSKPIGRSKRCDGMELNCPKCGSPLRVVVDQDAKVMVELVQRTSATTMKTNKTAVAPWAPDSARTVRGTDTTVKSVMGSKLTQINRLPADRNPEG